MNKSKIFGFTHRYPQSFLDKLAKDLGIKWTKCIPQTLAQEEVEIKPLNPPTSKLYYFKINYKNNE